MVEKEKRDNRPVLLRFGVALALTLGGILYSVLNTRRIKPSGPSPSPPSQPPSDCSNQVDSEKMDTGGGKAGVKNDYHSLQTTSSSCNTVEIVPEKHEESCLPKVAIENTISALSPRSRCNEDKDGCLFPEFNELVKEFDLATAKDGFTPGKDIETTEPDVEMPRAFIRVKSDDCEQEIMNLRNMVSILRERERTLEIQLLEFYGLKEQETSVRELQNRLKINNMEAKLFTLKIESLQANNRRLVEQVADYAKVVAELEAARAKIKMLEKTLRSEAEKKKGQFLTLQQRVTKLQDQEYEAVASDLDIQLNLQRLKHLEEEVEELRKSNYSLQLENSGLAQRLESAQILANSVLEDQEAEVLKEESRRLIQENEDLAKEIERLQADRCIDVEELVYLRWINACLRYELRNYQPAPGKTIARDLSKTLNPKSEEKAKQLILEYANREGMGENRINFMDFDFDQWSSSQLSCLSDSGEIDDSSVDNSSANKTNSSSKTKLFSKLGRLLRGEDSDHHTQGSSLEMTEHVGHVGDMVGTYSGDFPSCKSSISRGIDAATDGQGNRLRTSSLGSTRSSSDFQRLSVKFEDTKSLDGIQRNSDGRSSFAYKRIVSGREGVTDSPQENQLNQLSETIQRSELLKYAEVLKGSRGTTSKFRRRSTSYS